jgi:hypothetical protein
MSASSKFFSSCSRKQLLWGIVGVIGGAGLLYYYTLQQADKEQLKQISVELQEKEEEQNEIEFHKRRNRVRNNHSPAHVKRAPRVYVKRERSSHRLPTSELPASGLLSMDKIMATQEQLAISALPPTDPRSNLYGTPFERRDDIVDQSDFRKLKDPLTEPGRRPFRDQIPPAFVAQWLNIPTQPWDDAPTPIGYLYRTSGEGTERNHMLTLLSRRDYYRSTRQVYYAITDSGIKIQIEVPPNNRDEYFSGDRLKIPELGGEYEVKLYSQDGPIYSPYIL